LKFAIFFSILGNFLQIILDPRHSIVELLNLDDLIEIAIIDRVPHYSFDLLLLELVAL